ncbi:MAG: FtsH protease activity modulator HflK [Desulfobacterales bacterium]|nr:FtsH protease activity modulator HflK [Desulfobacterales bacterium]
MSWDWDKLQKSKDQFQNKDSIGLPPQMDEVFNKFKNGNSLSLLIIFLVIIYFASSMIYAVGVDEVGVIQRFGAYVGKAYPGLNIKFPTGIDKVTKVKVERIYKEEFGNISAGKKNSSAEETSNVSLMLTGDLNVVVVPWTVQYKIKDPYAYLFKVDNVNRLFRDLAEASMRLVIGDRSINDVISGRDEISHAAKRILQDELDKSETGIHILTIELTKTDVPEPVRPSFNEVNEATQEKERLIYKAKEDYNKEIPSAMGEAERIISVSEGYAFDRINRSEGDAERFLALYNEYAKFKDVTKRRLYLEMIKEVLPKVGKKYIVDPNNKLIPLINFGKISGETE